MAAVFAKYTPLLTSPISLFGRLPRAGRQNRDRRSCPRPQTTRLLGQTVTRLNPRFRSNNPLHLTAGVGYGVEVSSGCAPAAGERERSADREPDGERGVARA